MFPVSGPSSQTTSPSPSLQDQHVTQTHRGGENPMYHGQHFSQRVGLNPMYNYALHLPQQSYIHAIQPMLPSSTSGQPSTVQYHDELGECDSFKIQEFIQYHLYLQLIYTKIAKEILGRWQKANRGLKDPYSVSQVTPKNPS